MIKSKELGAIQEGKITAVDLLKNHNAIELIDDLCALLQNKKEWEDLVRPTPKLISVTEEEYERIKGLFRVKGYEANGEPTKRGRKPKNVD